MRSRLRTPLPQVRVATRFLTERALGFASQGFTLLASFIPLAFGLASQMVTVVQVTALATVLFQGSALAAGVRIPRESSVHRARSTSNVGLFFLAAVCVVIGLAAVTLHHLDHGYLQLYLLPLLLFGQGLFYIAMGWAIRSGDHSAVMGARLTFGVSTAMLTLLACLITGAGPSWMTSTLLIVAPAVAYTVAALSTLRRAQLAPHDGSEPFSTGRAALLMGELRAASRLSASTLIGAFASQAPALFIHSLAGLAPAWVVVNRVGSGLQTAGSQVLGPSVEIGVVKSLKDPDRSATVKVIDKGIVSGSVLAGTFLVTVVILAKLHMPDHPNSYALACLVVAALGLGAQVLVAPLWRAAALQSLDGFQIAWELTRAIACLVAIFTLSGYTLFGAFGVIYLISSGFYLVRIRRAAQERQGESRTPRPAASVKARISAS